MINSLTLVMLASQFWPMNSAGEARRAVFWKILNSKPEFVQFQLPILEDYPFPSSFTWLLAGGEYSLVVGGRHDSLLHGSLHRAAHHKVSVKSRNGHYHWLIFINWIFIQHFPGGLSQLSKTIKITASQRPSVLLWPVSWSSLLADWLEIQVPKASLESAS